MADILKLITGERYIDGTARTCYYLGTYQTDGWIYFNDDKFWRYNPSTETLQLLYLSKEIWCNTDIMEIKSTGNLNGSQAQNVINGAGSVAPNANVEKAVQWAVEKVTNNWITYINARESTEAQQYRAASLKDPNYWGYDCSTFVITAFYVGGFDAAATWTGDMVAAFEALGFTYIPMQTIPADKCIRGDILIKQFDPGGHTQIYIGNNQDVNCGDTPAQIVTHAETNYLSPYWDGIIRYK